MGTLKRGGPKPPKKKMSRVSMPEDIKSKIHKKAVAEDFKTDWEYIASKCL